jgi:glycosyltransferase involved in cell wall biosynthesis
MSWTNDYPLVSICIPTRSRVNILKNTLDSIFEDSTIDRRVFEVVISDNSPTDELAEIKDFYELYGNVRFVKSECIGFMNSINALDNGKGIFLKLLNDYSYFFDDSFSRLLNFFIEKRDENIAVSFTSGLLKHGEIIPYNSFEEFMLNLSYFSSWSSAFCIRRDAFLKLRMNVLFDGQFPHTSLTLSDRNSDMYIVNDVLYFQNMTVPKKGGTDLFMDFSVTYLGLLKSLVSDNVISQKTFESIKKKLLYDFLVVWYFNTKVRNINFTYYVTDTHKRILVNYSIFEYVTLVFMAYLIPFKHLLIRLRRLL